MSDKESLINYIKNQLHSEKSRASIKQSLVDVGWDVGDIDRAFYAIESAVPLPSGKTKDKVVFDFSIKGKQKLHTSSRQLFFISYFLIFIHLMFFLAFFGAAFGGLLYENELIDFDVPSIVPTVFFAFIFIGTAFLLWWSKKAYENYSFEFTEELFKEESGVISKHYASIPYTRIQNIDISRSFLERFLGLSSLYIQTAGSSSDAGGVLPGLEPQQAEKIKKEIMNYVSQLRAKGL